MSEAGSSQTDRAGAPSPAGPPRRILVVAEKPEPAGMIVTALAPDVAVLPGGPLSGALVADVQAAAPDVLVISCEVPEPQLFAALEAISQSRPLPVVMFVDAGDPGLARRALQAGVSAYIVRGLTPERIRPVIEVAIERFRMTDALCRELQKSREDLAARKTIERAKGLLMERRGLSEREAYEAMRRLAMAQGRPLREVAEAILSVSGILE